MKLYDRNGNLLLDSDSIKVEEQKPIFGTKRRSQWNNKELPVLYVNGDMSEMSKEVKSKLTYRFVSSTEQFTGFCTMKWQGNSSISWAKHNFTIQFFTDSAYKIKDGLDMGWGKHDKYVLKSNLNDATMARNVVSARLWGDIVRTRKNPVFVDTPNFGAINGFPIILYLNEEYWGLYDFNIPKDTWMFGVDASNDDHCVVCGEYNNDGRETTNTAVLACEFRNATESAVKTGWGIEIPDEYTAVGSSALVSAIYFVMNATDEQFVAGIDEYIDLESAIDYYIYAYFMLGSDSLARNMILATLDGKRWHCSMYDMDNTWGNSVDNTKNSPTTKCPEEYQETNSLLWQRIVALFPDKMYKRYLELRSTVLHTEYCKAVFEKFCGQIPDEEYDRDKVKWNRPKAGNEIVPDIVSFIEARASYCDTEFEKLNV